MQREIKFRAWVPKGYTRWGVSGGMIMLSWEDLIDDLHSEINPRKSVLGLGMNYKEEGVIFMQYTGLKDKNGKEIYEGDIVKNIENEVDFVDNYNEFIYSILYSEKHSGVFSWTQKEIEVIGNIYQNPELIK